MDIYERKSHLLNLHLNKKCTFAGEYDMPVLRAYLDDPPERLIPFNLARCTRDYDSGVHFFIDDYQFERIWIYPGRYLHQLRRFRAVIAPDFSQFADTPQALRIWQNYRAKYLASWWQDQGIRVIPNVTGSTPDSFRYCFDGLPTDSVVAINCLGIRSSALSMYFWREGYSETIRRLQPRLIIRYGDIMPGENEDVSIYYPNIYIEKLKQYGRKR